MEGQLSHNELLAPPKEGKHIFLHVLKKQSQGCTKTLCMALVVIEKTIYQVGMYSKAWESNKINCLLLAIIEWLKFTQITDGK